LFCLFDVVSTIKGATSWFAHLKKVEPVA